MQMNAQFRQRPRSTDDNREREDPKAIVVLPYIRHVSECLISELVSSHTYVSSSEGSDTN